jgi:hypothetical protein
MNPNENHKQMKFYKFRTCHAWGVCKWEYVRLPIGETPKSFFNSLSDKWSYSDKFRGVEYRKVKAPPKDWLLQQIADLKIKAENSEALAMQYVQLFKTL